MSVLLVSVSVTHKAWLFNGKSGASKEQSGGDRSELEHFWPVSLLPYFSKILERNYYKHLVGNKVFSPKNFVFQVGHSTTHAIIQLVNQIFEAFEENLYILVMDLNKLLIQQIIQYCLKKSIYMVWMVTTKIG